MSKNGSSVISRLLRRVPVFSNFSPLQRFRQRKKTRKRSIFHNSFKGLTRKNTIQNLKNNTNFTQENRPILILSIDGGGLRGKLTCQLLRELETQLRIISGIPDYKIHQAFDLIVGTSTGGLLALGLGKLEYTVDKCEQLYDFVAKEGFIQTWISWLTFNLTSYIRGIDLNIVGAKYYQSKLKKAIQIETNIKESEILLDNKTEEESNNKCKIACVVTCQCDGMQFPMLLRSYKHNNNRISTLLPSIPGTCQESITLIDAALATSAAPTYFKPVKKEIQSLDETESTKEVLFIDGGVSSNHPHMLAALEAKTLWPKRRVFLMSFGTGKTQLTDINDVTTVNEGTQEDTPNPVAAAFSAFKTKEFVSLYVMTVLNDLDLVDFIRFNPKIDKNKSKLDGKKYMNYWKEKGIEYSHEINDYIKICAQLLVNAQKYNIMNEVQNEAQNEENEESIA